VRVLQETPEANTGPEPAPERRSIELDGVSWQVVADGASVGGGALTPVHMLMLCFTEGDEGEAREAWVVGHRLVELPEDRLAEALRASAPRPERREPQGFFEELGGRRRR
jgi:hypothetical protein